MKNKKVFLVIIIMIVVVLVSFVSAFFYYRWRYKKDNIIPTDYIAVFYGGAGEITYSTYIYKIDNGKPNYGFRYINTENTTVSWGSNEWTSTVKKRGRVGWTDEVFSVAKKNGAYSYVTLPNDKSKTYTIEEFQKMFLMD